jgi:excinuclease UvrABC nuclease subunit
MTDTVFCYHCRVRHPLDEDRAIQTKSGKRWRCMKSIVAARTNQRERETFGRQTTAFNQAMAELRSVKPLPWCVKEQRRERRCVVYHLHTMTAI